MSGCMAGRRDIPHDSDDRSCPLDSALALRILRTYTQATAEGGQPAMMHTTLVSVRTHITYSTHC
jgi:hypothetical protein